MPPDREKFLGDIFDDPRMIEARKRVILALEQGPEILTRRFAAKLRWMRQCGEVPAAILLKKGRVYKVLRAQCHCRGCPVCESLRAARTRRALKLLVAERVAAGGRFSLITVTMPHQRTDLAQRLVALLFKALGRFQRSAPFRRHVFNWARGIEMPWSPENGFHPHAHYLVEATLWPKEEIKELWTRCMSAVGGPLVLPNGTHIKGLKDAGKGLKEVAGYPFKVQDLSTMPLAELCQLLFATRCRHLTQLSRPYARRTEILVAEDKASVDDDSSEERVETVAYLGLYHQARRGDRRSFDLLVDAATVLSIDPRTVTLAAGLIGFLRTVAESYRWPLPEGSDDGAAGPVPVLV